MTMKQQKIEIHTNGKHKGTRLYIDGQRVYFESLNISGSKESDYDIIVGLSSSKMSSQEIKRSCSADAVGFTVEEAEEYLEDDEE